MEEKKKRKNKKEKILDVLIVIVAIVTVGLTFFLINIPFLFDFKTAPVVGKVFMCPERPKNASLMPIPPYFGGILPNICSNCQQRRVT